MVLQATMRALVNHMKEEQMISVRMEVGSKGGAAQVILDSFVEELEIEEWGSQPRPIIRIRAKGLVIDMPRELALQLATAVIHAEEESKLEQARLDQADAEPEAYTGLPPLT